MTEMDELGEPPPPPPEVLELRAISDRWAQVVDWCQDEVNKAYRARTRALARLYASDRKGKGPVCSAICELHAARLKEIDAVEEEFHAAWRSVYDAVDDLPALEHCQVTLRPWIDAELKESTQRMQTKRLKVAEERIKFYKGRDERRKTRLSKRRVQNVDVVDEE